MSGDILLFNTLLCGIYISFRFLTNISDRFGVWLTFLYSLKISISGWYCDFSYHFGVWLWFGHWVNILKTNQNFQCLASSFYTETIFIKKLLIIYVYKCAGTFTFTFNTINNSVTLVKSSVLLFVEDTKIFSAACSDGSLSIQEDLNILQDWYQNTQLQYNSLKWSYASRSKNLNGKLYYEITGWYHTYIRINQRRKRFRCTDRQPTLIQNSYNF